MSLDIPAANGDQNNYLEIGSFRFQQEKLDRLASVVCELLGLGDYEVSLNFVDPQEIAELNEEYRKKNTPTDVLSFPQQEWPTPVRATLRPLPQEKLALASPSQSPTQLLGDVVICLEVANDNALKIGQALSREVCFLIVHGILHLCGHDHMEPDDEAIMLNEQNFIMSYLDRHSQLWNGVVFANKES